jgi:hypothetical protein
MCFGGGTQKVQQTTKQELSPEQRELLNTSMGLIKPVANNLPNMPGVPGFDPAQQQAQAGMLDKAGAGGPLETLSANAAKSTNFLTSGDVMNVDSNPHLRDAVDAAVRPLTEQFQQSVMPSVRGGAIQAGALGSSKAGQARDNAANSYMRNVGDMSSTMLNQAYGQNLEAMLKGIALTPQTQSASLFPQIVQDTVGGQRRTLEQQQAQQGFDESMFPFNMGLQLLGASAATPGGGTTSSVTGAQPQSSPLQQGLGTLMSFLAFL